MVIKSLPSRKTFDVLLIQVHIVYQPYVANKYDDECAVIAVFIKKIGFFQRGFVRNFEIF